MINNVNNLPTEFIALVKNDTSLFFLFLLCLNCFPHCNSLGIYRGYMSVGKINRKVTDENIPLVFSFVFIDFLIVVVQSNQQINGSI